MYNSVDTFAPYDGVGAVKLWGLSGGDDTENNIFQTFYVYRRPTGTQFSAGARVYYHHDDAISQDGVSLKLYARYFKADGSLLDTDESDSFTADSYDADEWHHLSFTSTIPEDAVYVNIGAVLLRPTQNDNG
jgi:hypothetical protein